MIDKLCPGTAANAKGFSGATGMQCGAGGPRFGDG
jgi:hypothetical protein